MTTKITATHSVGPWHNDGTWKDDIYSRDGRHLAQTCQIGESKDPANLDEEELANARLIAAAPELLEALEHAEALLRIVTTIEIEGGKSGVYGTGLASLRDKVNAAIRKARGL